MMESHAAEIALQLRTINEWMWWIAFYLLVIAFSLFFGGRSD